MKRNLLFATAAVAASLVAFTTAETKWNVDSTHANFGFSVRHMGINDMQGEFNKYDVSIKSAKADFSDAVVELTADASSIDTDNDMRDNHLKTADFFDVAKYPTITFKSTSFKKGKGNTYRVSGPLTMHGVTKDVELTATLGGTTQNPMSKKNTSGFHFTGVIKRSDFGIGGGMPTNILADEVTLNANAEFVQE